MGIRGVKEGLIGDGGLCTLVDNEDGIVTSEESMLEQ